MSQSGSVITVLPAFSGSQIPSDTHILSFDNAAAAKQPKRKLSAAGRWAIAEAQKKRWAAKKTAQAKAA